MCHEQNEVHYILLLLQAQYVFVHDALCEVIQCGDTEIPAARLGSAVETMSHTVPGDTSTGFQQQFEVHYYSN